MNDEELVDCPHCQAPTPFAPTSVAVEGTQAVEDLISSQLNLCQCKACDKPFLFETPLLYRDDRKRYLVYFVPPAFASSEDEALRQVTEFYDALFGDFSDKNRPECRLATNRSQLIEKISIHRQGFDDRLIEYVKYQLLEHSPGLDIVRHELLFDFVNSDSTSIQFIVFDRETRQPQYTLKFSPEDYQELAGYFLGEGREELNNLFGSFLVRVEDLVK